jgi:hypothetical protein
MSHQIHGSHAGTEIVPLGAEAVGHAGFREQAKLEAAEKFNHIVVADQVNRPFIICQKALYNLTPDAFGARIIGNGQAGDLTELGVGTEAAATKDPGIVALGYDELVRGQINAVAINGGNQILNLGHIAGFRRLYFPHET